MRCSVEEEGGVQGVELRRRGDCVELRRRRKVRRKDQWVGGGDGVVSG